ncbi:MAG: isochorismatase family protein [Rhodospirillaceae bacterium]|nr:isochorismatase family protein [Rhodospirillaceae bacterium]
MILDRARSQLLVVDVQDRLLPAMFEGERMVDRCAVLMRAAQRLGIPVTISEQYRKGLGATISRLDNIKGDAAVLEKMHFSCAADPAIKERVTGMIYTRPQLVVCGIESHVCVMQSVLGFKAMGLDVYTVADAVTSRASASVDAALQRMRHEGASTVTTEMALFEWLHVAGTPEFKELSKLIK